MPIIVRRSRTRLVLAALDLLSCSMQVARGKHLSEWVITHPLGDPRRIVPTIICSQPATGSTPAQPGIAMTDRV